MVQSPDPPTSTSPIPRKVGQRASSSRRPYFILQPILFRKLDAEVELQQFQPEINQSCENLLTNLNVNKAFKVST